MEQVQIAALIGAIAGIFLGLVFGSIWGKLRERAHWEKHFKETFCSPEEEKQRTNPHLVTKSQLGQDSGCCGSCSDGSGCQGQTSTLRSQEIPIDFVTGTLQRAAPAWP